MNTLALVAPPEVLRAVYAYQDEARWNNPDRSPERLDAALSVVMRTVRRDVQPSPLADGDLTFRLFDVPPSAGQPPNVTLQATGTRGEGSAAARFVVGDRQPAP